MGASRDDVIAELKSVQRDVEKLVETTGAAVEGTVADVIVGSLKKHYRGHLAELATALAA